MVKTSPPNARGDGLIPGRGSEVPHASWPKSQNVKQEQYFYKFNTIKMVHIKKKQNLKKNRNPSEWALVLSQHSPGKQNQ